MRKLTLLAALVSFILFAGITLCEEVLTNNSVIKMHQAGLPSSVIVAKIQSSKTDFDTSVDELINLAKSDVPEEVITAMTKAVERPESSVSQRSGAYSGPVTLGSLATAQPMAPNQFTGPECSEPGIFLLTEDGIMEELEPSMYMGSKSSGLWKSALTYGIASQKTKAMLQGLKANTRISDRSPTFYFGLKRRSRG